jgi:hypothetical protein
LRKLLLVMPDESFFLFAMGNLFLEKVTASALRHAG